MEIIFDKAGDGKTVTLDKIKKYAKEINGTSSPFLKGFDSWKNTVTKDAINEKFYENNGNKKALFSMYALIGLVIVISFFSIGVLNFLTFLVILATVIYLVYI